MSAMSSLPVRPFCVDAVSDGGEAVVALTGELDVSCADVLEREVRRLRRAGFDRVVVDLCRVVFVDSSGLRALISLRNTAQREGHRLVLRPGPPRVQRIFDLTATRGLFDWRD